MDATRKTRPRTILMADDDIEEFLLLREALIEIGHRHDLRLVRDGDELLEYLTGGGRYADGAEAPRPDLVLLDLKMPRRDGREVLSQLRDSQHLRRIPVVVLTSSSAADDVAASYELGANSYIRKPATFREVVAMVDMLTRYWFDLAELPAR